MAKRNKLSPCSLTGKASGVRTRQKGVRIASGASKLQFTKKKGSEQKK